MDSRTDERRVVSMLEQSDWLSLATLAASGARKVLDRLKALGGRREPGFAIQDGASKTRTDWRNIRLFRM